MVGGGYYEMTKKFWNDWQKRVGETKQIYLVYESFGKKINKLWYARGLLSYHLDGDPSDRIISIKFKGDTIDMVIERQSFVSDLSSRRGYHYHSENEYVTLKREDIISVEFFENYK